jgi:hypothetical protein
MNFRIRFVIYVYATFMNVENVHMSVRQSVVGRYILQRVEKCLNGVFVRSLISS